MGATTTRQQGHFGTGGGAGGYSGRSVQPQLPYWGWSHENQRLEMMDLPTYIDSLRQTYDAALTDLSNRLQSLSTMVSGLGMPVAAQQTGSHGRHPHRRHRHGDRCGCDCGCGRPRDCDCDCGCDCCICDADVVVYTHCGETRIVPIEVANDTRREREDVTVEVSDVRSAGGNVRPWEVTVLPAGPLTLPACSTTKLELVVHVVCDDDSAPKQRSARAKEAETSRQASTVERGRFGDVDECEVGYVTIRLGGCSIRPIVVAIAALPLRCDSYRVGCSCSCCC